MANRTPPTLSSRTDPSGLLIISLSGELDTYSTRLVGPEFTTALGERNTWAIVDLSGVTFITSAALAMFVAHAQALQRGGGCLQMAAAREIVADVFTRAGFNSIFPIFKSVGEAVDNLKGRDHCFGTAPLDSHKTPPREERGPHSDDTSTTI